MAAAPTFLCRLNDLRDGQSRGFDPAFTGHDSVLLVRQGMRVFAYRDACPHYGDTPLAWRKDAYLDAEHAHVVCSAHGAVFEIATGRCMLGPCIGQFLTPLALARRPNGEIHLASPLQNTDNDPCSKDKPAQVPRACS